MAQYVDKLIEELRGHITDLGKDGGGVNPSIYDTAQVLRLYPPAQGVRPGLRWLMSEQRADGGWGDLNSPMTRDVPTLAAVVTLQRYCTNRAMKWAVEAGIEFLGRQASQWTVPLPDDLPVAAELILPGLVNEGIELGLGLSLAPYAALIKQGDRKRKVIVKLKPGAGTPFVFSWEAWGDEPHPDLVDPIGSVGNSPAATAAWLRAAKGRPELAEQVGRAEGYLASANRATNNDIPGLAPTAWPINRFEQTFALHGLMIAGLLDHARLRNVVMSQLADLDLAMSDEGIGFSDYFDPDGDDTAAAVAVLNAGGLRRSPDALMRFRQGDHFSAYPQEFQPSISVTARAVDALAFLDLDISKGQEFLVKCQEDDGRWLGDKWNISWLYTTSVVLSALRGTDYKAAKKAAWDVLRMHQHADGGWGIGQESTMLDTAYGLLSARILLEEGLIDTASMKSVLRAHSWLMRSYRLRKRREHHLWVGKELYGARRIDQVFILGAVIGITLSVSMPEKMPAKRSTSARSAKQGRRYHARHRHAHLPQSATGAK